MGIAISKDKIRRPYRCIPKADLESNQHTINVEVSVPNGLPAVALSKFEKVRWDEMLGGTMKHRYATK